MKTAEVDVPKRQDMEALRKQGVKPAKAGDLTGRRVSVFDLPIRAKGLRADMRGVKRGLGARREGGAAAFVGDTRKT
jgi:transcription antitermination factor NusA-like protein